MIEGYRAFASARSLRTVLLRGDAELPENRSRRGKDAPGGGEAFRQAVRGRAGPGSLWDLRHPAGGEAFRGPGRYLYLDGLQDPGNVGTLLRTAAAFALDGVLLGPGTADPFSPKVVRSAAGAVFAVPLVPVTGPGDLAGHELVAADMEGASPPGFRPAQSLRSRHRQRRRRRVGGTSRGLRKAGQRFPCPEKPSPSTPRSRRPSYSTNSPCPGPEPLRSQAESASSTSASFGIEALPPRRVTERPAAAEAKRRASRNSRPLTRAQAKAPWKMSPAAVLSTAFTGRTGSSQAVPRSR